MNTSDWIQAVTPLGAWALTALVKNIPNFSEKLAASPRAKLLIAAVLGIVLNQALGLTVNAPTGLAGATTGALAATWLHEMANPGTRSKSDVAK